MNYCRYLILGLMAFVISGCGQTVTETLKQPLVKKSTAGADKTIVILPFADYSQGDNITDAFHRSLYINASLTDELVSNSFRLPVQEDVFRYLVDQNIINVVAYENKSNNFLEDEIQNGEWSTAMKAELKRYDEMSRKAQSNKPVLSAPGTHGLSRQEIVKIGRHFNADYILRGRIIQYTDRKDPSWAPWKKGILTFVTGAGGKIAFGNASSESYDEWSQMIAGAAIGGLIGSGVNWPYTPGKADQEILGVSGGRDANTLIWGAVGGGMGKIGQKSGDTPQAVVQLRIWIQDAYTGDVVWTNRVDVKVSPETFFADYQYDALFEAATEKAVSTLIDNFTQTL